MHNNLKLTFNNKIILKRIIFFLLLLTTFYIIFGFSSQSKEKSSSISVKVTQEIVNVMSQINLLQESKKTNFIIILHPIIRKIAHFCLYTLVGVSSMGLACTYRIKDKNKILISIIIGIIYAISDEIHQSFIPGRGPKIYDIGIDTLGVIFGIFIIIVVISLFNKSKRKNKKIL